MSSMQCQFKCIFEFLKCNDITMSCLKSNMYLKAASSLWPFQRWNYKNVVVVTWYTYLLMWCHCMSCCIFVRFYTKAWSVVWVVKVLVCDTHNANLWHFDIANSLWYHAGFTPMSFQWSNSHMKHFSLWLCCNFFYSAFFLC